MWRFFLSIIFLTALNTSAQLPENLTLTIGLKKYEPEKYNQVVNHRIVQSGDHQNFRFENSEWKVTFKTEELEDKTDAIDVSVKFVCTGGALNHSSLSVNLNFNHWSTENYVMVPAALYNGNRYPWRRIRYSPKLMDPRDIGPDKGIILSDVNRLNHQDGPSFVQLRSGAMATPSACFWDVKAKKGVIMLTTQETKYGDNGIRLEENRARDKFTISVMAPVVRELYKYRITDSQFPSDDIPARFTKGDSLILQLRLYSFHAPELQDLFDKFAEVRKDFAGTPKYNNRLPFSEAFKIQQEKFNRDNWVDEFGYYSVGMRENFLQDWQIGWTGGMISTYPLLFAGNQKTVDNVIRNFDWLFPDGISPSGFFWDSGEDGDKWYGGDIRKPHTSNWHLVRKSGDGLFFILHQLFLMKEKGIQVKKSWETGTQGVADAFVRLWQENGQLGQFVDNRTGEIQVGGSTSGAIVPAALVRAGQYFSDDTYLATAEQIAGYFYTTYTKKGLAFGGPGDAMQNFDSESGYAIIESYMALYEATNHKKWLKAAEDAAKQFATWVMSYNFNFPETSTYGKLKIEALGAVFANTQNTHGSPGICTHSGLALFKLYRATQNPFYLDLLSDITHAIPQCLAHPNYQMPGVKDGWINERINTSDWLEGIGEMMYGSTWAETSLMLSYIQIPGLYVVPDQSLLVAFDNLEARIVKETPKMLEIEIYNPTEMDANLTFWVENSRDLNTKLDSNFLLNTREEYIPAKGKKKFTFNKQHAVSEGS
jgi:hypothetical protein